MGFWHTLAYVQVAIAGLIVALVLYERFVKHARMLPTLVGLALGAVNVSIGIKQLTDPHDPLRTALLALALVLAVGGFMMMREELPSRRSGEIQRLDQ
jgi:predicted tellurium resistance membrane protein TerC